MSLTSLVLALVAIASDPTFSPAVRGTVWIRAGDKAVGTGWVVDTKRRWVITARHVLADRDKVEVFLPDYRDGKLVADRVQYLSERADLLKRGRLATGKLVAKNDNADLALIALDQMPADVPALKLSSRPPKPGHECSCIGHRHDAELLWNRTTGSIRQVGQLTDGYFWAGTRIGAKSPVLFVQSPIELGESGAAVLDDVGKVIGVVSAVSNRTPGLAIAINVSEVQKLLTEARQDSPITKVTQGVEKRPDVAALMHGSVWVRPRSTEGRAAGVLINRERKLVLTTAAAVGSEEVIDVVSPKWDKDRLVAEASEYQDLLGLRLSKHCVQGVVLARDLNSDLAVIELDHAPESLYAIPLAAAPKMGDRVAAISHPSNEELMWLYAAGTVRSVGKVKLSRDGGDEAVKVMTSLLQLPHQGSASGGPVVNERGELVGILASREGARQELAYAVTTEEIREFLKAVRPLSKPTSAVEWSDRARFMAKMGRTDAVLAWWDAALLAPKDAVVLASQARAMAYVSSPGSTDIVIEKLLTLQSLNAEAEGILAETYQVLNRRKLAAKSVDRAMKANPKSAGVWATQGWLRSSNADAMKDFAEAISLDASLPRTYLLRAERRDPKDTEYHQSVLADLTRAIELDPHNDVARIRRARLFEETKDFKKAAREWTWVVENEPLSAWRRMSLARAEFTAGNRAAAARERAAAYRIEPKSLPKVVQSILESGESLLGDNPADTQRVMEWYRMALRELIPWLPAPARKSLESALKQAEQGGDNAQKAKLLAESLENVGEPSERPPK